MDKIEFKKEINDKRKTNTWYFFKGIVEGSEIVIKGFKTWLQICIKDNVNYPSAMEISVKQFNANLDALFD